METNSVQGVEQLAKCSMMKKALQENLGDGMEFELVYQSFLDNLQKTATDDSTKQILNTLSNENISNAISKGASLCSAGQPLEDLPLTINSDLDYLNLNGGLGNISRAGSVSTTSSDSQMQQIYASVNKYASQYGVDPNLVLAVIKTESDFDPNTTSGAGAMGLMQLMPENCEEDGVTSPYDINDNIKGGVKQLKGLLDRYNGDISMALMAYNAGSGTMQNRGVTSSAQIYKMPSETQNYVPKVLGYYRQYAQA